LVNSWTILSLRPAERPPQPIRRPAHSLIILWFNSSTSNRSSGNGSREAPSVMMSS
jgi:hypothetical protein